MNNITISEPTIMLFNLTQEEFLKFLSQSLTETPHNEQIEFHSEAKLLLLNCSLEDFLQVIKNIIYKVLKKSVKPPEDALFTQKEAANFVGVSEVTFIKHKHKINCSFVNNISRQLFFLKSDLLKFMGVDSSIISTKKSFNILLKNKLIEVAKYRKNFNPNNRRATIKSLNKAIIDTIKKDPDFDNNIIQLHKLNNS